VSWSEGFVWVLDAKTNQIVSRIKLEAEPAALEFAKDGSVAFVVVPASRMVVSIDCGSRRVLKTATIGKQPGTPKLAPNGKLLLVPDRDDASLFILNADTLELVSILPVVRHPEQIVILPDSSKAFVTSSQVGHVAVVDLSRLLVATHLNLGVGVTGGPAEATLKPDGGELYLSHPAAHGLVILNTWTNEVSEFVTVGDAPSHVVPTQDGTRLFVADASAGRIIPIDVNSRRTSDPIPTGKNPAAIVFTPGEELLLVVNQGSNDLAVIRKRTLSLLTMIPVGSRPRDVAVLLF
jgi:YVTN family beta-propeller protein